MKFKADKKDFIIFFIFCIFLFYMVCLFVSNLNNFVVEGRFLGLSPFRALSTELFPLTMVIYISVLIAAFTSVQNLFFDREKGLGISFDKKEKDEARWAKKKEIQKVLARVYASDEKYEAAGIPIISDGEEIYVDNGESHSLIVGTTGSGKTALIVKPLIEILSRKGESVIVTDPKGELYEETASTLKDRGYNIVVLNLRNPRNGNAWNPMNLPYKLMKEDNTDKAIELLEDLAINILYDEKNKNGDPFWEKTSADYFTGLALGLFEDATEDEINLNSINYMSTVGEDRFAQSTFIQKYFEHKDPSKAAYINAASTIMSPTETKGSILSVFKQKIKLFSSRETLSEMLSFNDFDMKDIGKKKTAVFLIIQDEKKTYHSLATIFLKQVYETLIDVAQECGGKLPVRTNFVLDEFANMPPLKDVTTMITAARSRQIRFNMIIQNFAQLNEVYGKENAETIKGNCSNLIYLLSTELQALEEISKLAGEVKEKSDKDKKDTGGKKPLISISQLQRLKFGEVIVIKHRQFPFKTKLPGIWDYKFNNSKKEEAKYPVRDKREIKLFNLKEFVKEKEKKKLFDVLDMENNNNNKTIPNPFMNKNPLPMDNISNPFMNKNPFGGGEEITNPFNKDPLPPVNDIPFDYDAFMKKIEAKLKEEEDKLAAENNKTDNTTEEVKEENKTVVEAGNINDNENNKVIELKEEKVIEKEKPREIEDVLLKTDHHKTETHINEEKKKFEAELKENPFNHDNKVDLNSSIIINEKGKSINNKDQDLKLDDDVEVLYDDDFFDDFFMEE